MKTWTTMKLLAFVALAGVAFGVGCKNKPAHLLTTSYQSRQIIQAFPKSNYFKANLCQQAYLGKFNVMISAIMPNNPNWCPSKGKVYLEVSKCAPGPSQQFFNSSCIVASNYILKASASGKTPHPHAKTVFSFEQANLGPDGEVYIRVWNGQLASSEVELLVDFHTKSDSSLSQFQKATNFFPNDINPQIDTLAQFTKLGDGPHIVETFDNQCYEFAFCREDSTTARHKVDVAVTSTDPLSAFVTYSCEKQFGLENCYPGGDAALTCDGCFDGDVNPYNFITIPTSVGLTNGILYIEGYGGNPDNVTCPENRGMNTYDLFVKLRVEP